jgi:hypothetical protein
MDHGFHLIEHAVDDSREPRERIVDISIRQTLAQITRDDALDALIDLVNALLGAQAEPCAGEQAKTEGRQQTKRQRLADNVGNFTPLIDVASDDQDITV